MPLVRVVIAVVLAGIAGIQEARAQSSCPTTARLDKSIELASAGGRKNTLTWMRDGRVRIVEVNPAEPRSFPRTTIALHGLLGVEVGSPGGAARVKYEPAATEMFPLVVGREAVIGYASELEGGKLLEARMGLVVIEALRHKIGDCTYEAMLVVRFSELEGGQRSPLRYDVYVPSLQAVVKSTLFDETAGSIIEAETFEFETIVEK